MNSLWIYKVYSPLFFFGGSSSPGSTRRLIPSSSSIATCCHGVLPTFCLSPQQSNQKWKDDRPLPAGHPSINSSFCSRFHWFHWFHFIPASTAHLSQSVPAAFRCPSQWQLWFSPSAPAAERFFVFRALFCAQQRNGNSKVTVQCVVTKKWTSNLPVF